MSRFNVTLAPADHVSWSAARDALMSEAKHGLRASLDAEMAAVGTDASEETMHELRARFAAKEREIEHDIDHTVHTFTAAYDMVRPTHAPPAFCPSADDTCACLVRGSPTTSSRSERW